MTRAVVVLAPRAASVTEALALYQDSTTALIGADAEAVLTLLGEPRDAVLVLVLRDDGASGTVALERPT